MSDFSPNPEARDPRYESGTESAGGFGQPSGGLPAHQPFPPAPSAGTPAFAYQPPPPAATSTGTRGMYTAAAVLNWITLAIVSVATFGFGLIAAFWVVPMTIQIHKGAKGPYKHTALGVCTLLFINFISGILMLVDDGNRPPKPTI